MHYSLRRCSIIIINYCDTDTYTISLVSWTNDYRFLTLCICHCKASKTEEIAFTVCHTVSKHVCVYAGTFMEVAIIISRENIYMTSVREQEDNHSPQV